MAGFGPKKMGLHGGPREKADMKSVKKLFAYCKPYFPSIIIALFLALVGAIATIVGPDKISEMMDIITSGLTQVAGIDMDEFMSVVIFLICLYAAGALAHYIQQFIMAGVTQKTSKRLRTDINKKINKLPLRYFDTTTRGDLLSRVTNDVDTIAQSLGSTIANLVNALVLFLGVLIMMFTVNWILALVTIGTSILGFMLMFIIIGKSQKYFSRRQQNIGEMNGQIEEVYTNHNVVKSYTAENDVKKRFSDINNKLYENNFKSQCLGGLMHPLMGFAGNLSYAAIFIIGVALILNGSDAITFGTIISFTIYARLFSQPLTTIAQSMNMIQQTAAASKRVFELLEEEEMIDESQKKVHLNENDTIGSVEFRNVRFAYNADKTIINNFNIKLAPGQKVAIVGPTGAGKTTIVNLLMRFYELRQPRLIINGEMTDYKVFDNGKSIRIMVNDNKELFINDEKTKYHISDSDNLPKNKILKFNQDFNLSADNEDISYKATIVTGNDIDYPKSYGFAVAYYGYIFIDDVPTKSMTRENIHDLFDMILQDTWLFDGTIRENLVYNKKDVSNEKLDEVCAAVGLKHFIHTLKKGYDTKLNNNLGLSEGQKQQLTIARAMIKDSPLLILDEATSSVDTRTEIVIQEAMDELTKGRTSFVIAHRLSTIKNAGIILVLKDGDIIEHGNHSELLAKNGFYAELYNSQFAQV
ncbi:MAG: ABC transporter ATP-binding protein [Acholeplasmatales bacterium]|nr:ABC transporter ATP-binding protein [Acholeplasmatales bacterium]